MVEKICIDTVIELDDVHGQMLEEIRAQVDAETVDNDLQQAALDEQAVKKAIYNGYTALQDRQR